MAVLWTEDLATGVRTIDSQHKELFVRINDLLEGCKIGKGKIEVEKLIRFLEDYVVTHFAEEEKHMLAHGYPGYAEHKAQHKEFMENFMKIRNQLEAEGPGLAIVVSTNHFVVDWLKSHIRRVDTKLGNFLKEKAPSL